MKAIGIRPGENRLDLLDVAEPQIKKQASHIDKVLIKVEKVGVSSMDRRYAGGEPFTPPPESSHLVLGHEMVGRVVDIGPEVKTFKVGDMVVLTVRHGCGLCVQCVRGNGDLCLTGLYTDRGMHRLDGFMTEYVMESLGYVVPIPPAIQDVAVLLAPLSLAEKAAAAAVSIGHRMDYPYPFPEHAYHYKDWGFGKTGLVVGGTATALMAAFLLKINSLKTYLMTDQPKDSLFASIVEEIGATYITLGAKEAETIVSQTGRIDLIIEATGSPEIDFRLTELMGHSGVLALTSIPAHDSMATIDGNRFMRERMLRSQVVFGATSASRQHYEQGVEDMQRIKKEFGSTLNKVVTHSYPFSDYEIAFSERNNVIKAVLEL